MRPLKDIVYCSVLAVAVLAVNCAVFGQIPEYNIVPCRTISADNPQGMVYRDDGFWVMKSGATHAEDALQHYSLAGDFLDQKTNLPGSVNRHGLAWDGMHWWLADNNYGPESIYKCDENLNVIQRYDWPAAGPFGLEWADGYLWVADNSTDVIYRVTVGETAFVSVEPWCTTNPEPADLAWDGANMWSSTGPSGGFDGVMGDRVIYKHDAEGNIIEIWHYPPADDPSVGSGGTATGIAFVGSQLWYCDYDQDLIIEALAEGVPCQSMPVEVSIFIDPETLNPGSRGKWVMCYIVLPDGYITADIDVGTLELQGVPADRLVLTEESDLGMAQFDRKDIAAAINGIDTNPVEFTLTGLMNDGTGIVGKDWVTIIDRGRGPKK